MQTCRDGGSRGDLSRHFINIVDRLTLAAPGPVITKQLGLSASEFASLTTVFLIAYTMSQELSGRVYDRIGAKRGFTMSIVVRSAASLAHRLAGSLFALNCLRFLLGLGGNWPRRRWGVVPPEVEDWQGVAGVISLAMLARVPRPVESKAAAP